MGIPTLGNQRTLEAILKMFAFRIIAFTDLPLLQLLIACGVGWFRSVRVQSSCTSLDAESILDEAGENTANPYHPPSLS